MSDRTYAYKIENGVVVDGIVGTAAWAIDRLGGLWIDSDRKVWVGGTWDETNGFQPPADE